MKKILMGTTALAAGAGFAAGDAVASDPISLSVGGYYQNVISFVDQDDDAVSPNDFNEVNVRQEGEIHFKGETTLDNGLTVGFQAQLEAVTQGDQIDETYLYFTGSWGRLLMGSENSAPYLMSYAAPSEGLGINSPNFYLFSPAGAAATTGYLNQASDANKVTYFTPRFGGFQLGVSYTPNRDAIGGDRQTFGLNTDEDPGDHNNLFGVGVNFVESFDAIDVAVFAGYEFANSEEDGANSDSDANSWMVGGQVGFSGFTIGGSYTDSDHGSPFASALLEEDREFYTAGVSYGTGPWGVSFTYAHSSQDLAGGGEDERDQFEVGASYALGPGVSVRGSVQYMDEDNDSTSDIDGFGVAVGTFLSF